MVNFVKCNLVLLSKYAFLVASSLRDPENRIARQKKIQIGGGDVSGRPKDEFFTFCMSYVQIYACLMC